MVCQQNATGPQLFTAFSGNNPLFDEESIDMHYGVGSDTDSSSDEDTAIVVIPAISPPVSEHDMHALQLAINPLQDSDCYGTDFYLHTLFFINNALESN